MFVFALTSSSFAGRGALLPCVRYQKLVLFGYFVGFGDEREVFAPAKSGRGLGALSQGHLASPRVLPASLGHAVSPPDRRLSHNCIQNPPPALGLPAPNHGQAAQSTSSPRLLALLLCIGCVF